MAKRQKPATEEITKKDLCDAVVAADAAKQQWQASSEEMVSREFEAALKNAFALAAEAEKTRDKESLILQIGLVELQWHEFEHAYGGQAVPEPNRDFWREYDACLRKARGDDPDERPISSLEPVALLHEQKVPLRQIAKIYDWFLPNGEPDAAKVWEEIQKPGTHVGPDFVPPMERERQRALKQKNQRAAALIEKARRARSQSSDPDAPPPQRPESIEDLLRTVHIKQVLKMAPEYDEAQLRKIAAENNIKIVESHGIGVGTFDRDRTEDEQRVLDAQLPSAS